VCHLACKARLRIYRLRSAFPRYIDIDKRLSIVCCIPQINASAMGCQESFAYISPSDRLTEDGNSPLPLTGKDTPTRTFPHQGGGRCWVPKGGAIPSASPWRGRYEGGKVLEGEPLEISAERALRGKMCTTRCQQRGNPCRPDVE
jgi:hypothetical protein